MPFHACRKGRLMTVVEELEVYSAYTDTSERDFILNDQLNIVSNLLYDTALKLFNNGRSKLERVCTVLCQNQLFKLL